MKTFVRAGVATGLLLATLGAQCPEKSPTATHAPGLVQTVRIEPAEPRTGDQITIRTEVTNAGLDPAGGTFLLCALEFGGDLELSEVPGHVRCGGYSHERQLAAGESVEAIDTKVVDSAPGTYVLEVRHLISPAMSQRVTVRVLPK